MRSKICAPTMVLNSVVVSTSTVKLNARDTAQDFVSKQAKHCLHPPMDRYQFSPFELTIVGWSNYNSKMPNALAFTCFWIGVNSISYCLRSHRLSAWSDYHTHLCDGNLSLPYNRITWPGCRCDRFRNNAHRHSPRCQVTPAVSTHAENWLVSLFFLLLTTVLMLFTRGHLNQQVLRIGRVSAYLWPGPRNLTTAVTIAHQLDGLISQVAIYHNLRLAFLTVITLLIFYVPEAHNTP